MVDEAGAGLAPPCGCRRGAASRFREGISRGTDLGGRALPASPRYHLRRAGIFPRPSSILGRETSGAGRRVVT